MSDVINLLSSDEEDLAPPKKRIRPTFIQEVRVTPIKVNKNNGDDIVILSDDECVDRGTTHLSGQNGTDLDEDNDSVTFIDEKSDLLIEDSKPNSKMSENGSRKGKEKAIKHNIVQQNIIIDENSSEESSGKENKSQNLLSKQINNITEPSTSGNQSDTLFEKFLDSCESTIVNSPYEHLRHKQFPSIRKYYNRFGTKLGESSNFTKLIEENMERSKKSPAAAVISFNEVFQYIRSLIDAESVEVSEEHRIKLKKLEKTIKLLTARIKYLENAEVDFNDEEDSTYLQLDRFENRLNKVYEKYCQLLKKNPHSGRITYEKLDFVDSEYNEINREISKKYKNNKKFPSYYELEQFIKTVSIKHNLDLTESKIKTESVRCFKKLGELLQSRRKKELYEAHYLYIRDTEDPADKDTALESTLKSNFIEGQIKIEKVCEDFAIKQECGDEAKLSEEDSDKSNYVDSENEDNDEK